MLVDSVTTYLEMTSPDQLIPGRPPPQELHLERLPPNAANHALVASTQNRIGGPHHWTLATPELVASWLAERPQMKFWLATVAGAPAGMLELQPDDDGGVEISSFGLTPEFVGKGYGGRFLTLATRIAWTLPAGDGGVAKRVWLHTSSLDHEHALPNYLARGYRIFKKEKRQREIPG